MFIKATKQQLKLRLLIEGASGSGKTFSALQLAKGLGGKVAVIDTERGSASLYSDKFDFDVCELDYYSPEKYIEAIKYAQQDYDVIIIDSITHEWSGEGGILDIHRQLGGQFNDWSKVTPKHNAFINAILASNAHIICTARTKSDYVIEQVTNRRGKSVNAPTKVGLKSEQRDGLDYEFTIVFRVNQQHLAESTKDRTGIFSDFHEVLKEEHAVKISNWLNDGVTADEYSKQQQEQLVQIAVTYLTNCTPEKRPEALAKAIGKYGDRPEFEQFKTQ